MMNKKNIIKIIVFVISILIIGILLTVFIIKKREEKRDMQIQINNRQIGLKLELYAYTLNGKVEYEFEGENLIVTRAEFVDKRIALEVVLYNTFYPDNPVSEQQLMDEFMKFCTGMKDSEVLYNYDKNLAHLYNDLYLDKRKYFEQVRYETRQRGTPYSDATIKQMLEAAQQVADRYYEEYNK